MKIRHLYLVIFLIVYLLDSKACDCPHTSLSLEECSKYEIIFKGRVVSVKNCENKYGEAVFEIDELYKGDAAKNFKVLFECKVPCAQQFNVGDEWVIYSIYKQVNNAMMNWCSRSRKFFKVEKLDFYTVNYGNDYYDEVKFLREKLGLHRFIKEEKASTENRNIKPSSNQMIIILICSLATVILFYWLFNKYFKF